MPTLSIVIPAYNEGAFIGQLLTKILAVPTESMGFDKEIIVVNDGSKDNRTPTSNTIRTITCQC